MLEPSQVVGAIAGVGLAFDLTLRGLQAELRRRGILGEGKVL